METKVIKKNYEYEIGIGITERNRPEVFKESLAMIKKYMPKNAKLVIVDDASDTPVVGADYRFEENAGIAKAKNKCLELLQDCKHIFLFDSDTYPTKKGWEKDYINSNQPHLMYGFPSSPIHWETTRRVDDELVYWDKPRGCMIYIQSWLLPIVGGMHVVFGKHGAEHGDWSDRIHKLGYTKHAYGDVLNPSIHCMDEDSGAETSAERSNNWMFVDRSKLPVYAEYRERKIPVFVPRKSDGDHRDRIWRWLRENYWSALDEFEIIEGWHEDGPFNRSHAINLASNIAGNWDVAIIADGDVFINPQALRDAVDLARSENKLVSCLNEVREINQQTSYDMIRSNEIYWDVPRDQLENIRTTDTQTQSLFLAVSRNAWEQAKGFDERFVGWGGEDNAFWKTCELTTGQPLRLNYPAYHIWHKSADKKGWGKNNRLWMMYRNARNRRDLTKARGESYNVI